MEPRPLPVRRRRRLPILLVAAAALIVPLLATVGAHASQPSPPSGWSLVWGDDFTGAAGSGVGSAWQYDVGTSYPGGPAGFGTGEVETMTNSTNNVALDGSGNLKITPVRDSAGNWTSGRIETARSDFQAPAGGKLRIESRIQVPNVTGAAALGYWPAFWMLGTPYRGNYWNWPAIGEFDIMENTQGLDRVWGTLHCGTTPGGQCNETTGLGNNVPCPGSSCQSAFHTYALEWDRSTTPEQLRWYVDGTQYHSVSSSQVDAATWANATGHGFFVLLNVSMGGAFPAAFGGGPTSATESGHPMVVDYVAVWSNSGSSGGPAGYTLCAAENGTCSFTGTASVAYGANGAFNYRTATTSIACNNATFGDPLVGTRKACYYKLNSGSSDYTQGVTKVSASQVQLWFTPTTAAAYVDVHYLVNGANQRNFRMTNNSGTWQQSVSSLAAGAVVEYWFTYEKSGPQYDTGHFTYTNS